VFPVGTVLLGYVSLFGTTVTDIFAQNQLANETYIAKTNFHHVSYLAPEIELHFLSIAKRPPLESWKPFR
jgi:hypothetical protein